MTSTNTFIDRKGKEWTKPLNTMANDRHGSFAIFKNNNKILLTWPFYAPDVLDLPGGAIDPGETAEQALLRETKEETGFLFTWQEPLIYLKHIFPFYAEDLKGNEVFCNYTQEFFLFDISSIREMHFNGKINAPEDSHMEWIDIKELSKQPINVAHLTALENLDFI